MNSVMKKEPRIHLPGEAVEVADMLQARDGRAAAQKKLLAKYGQPLLCFTMNIPGPVKTSLLIRLGFLEGVRRLETAFLKAKIPVLYKKRIAYKTGYEEYYVLQGDAREIKKNAAEIENQDRVGRLFDMDVLDIDGRKLSRTELGLPGRLCLVCDEPAQACARSRKHAVPVLVRKIHRTLWEMLQGWTEKALLSGLLGEVYATPKPGLVDRNNPGAHKDMDVETFEKSTQAILPYLLQMGEKGWDWTGTGTELFTALRPLGAAAEKAMFLATNNVNTHKGIIFSLGLVTSFGHDILASTYLLQLLVLANTCFYESTWIPENLMPQLSSQIMRYIDEHLTEDLSIQALADHLYMNRSHMSRKFREQAGCSIQEYMILKRISLAKTLLKQGKSVTDTCELSGFHDYSNFIRTFKKYAQVSPGHYRVTNMEA